MRARNAAMRAAKYRCGGKCRGLPLRSPLTLLSGTPLPLRQALMGQFDLVRDGWLPLRRRSDGGLLEVGIEQALIEADAFAELVVELPTQVPALLRQVLLPIV